MKFTRFIWIIACFFAVYNGFSQTNSSINIQGFLVNSNDSSKIENAIIQSGKLFTYSNAEGYFEIFLSSDAKLTIRHPGFQNKNIKLAGKQESPLIVYLEPKKNELQEVQISAKETFFFGGVQDFVWIQDRLLVAHYKGNKHWFDVRENGGDFAKLTISRDVLAVEEFITDCYQRVYGVHGDLYTRITLVNDSVVLGASIPKADFEFFRNRCVLSDNHLQVYKYLTGHNKGAILTLVNSQEETETKLYQQLDTMKYIKSDILFNKWCAAAGVAPNHMGDIYNKSDLDKVYLAFDLKSAYKAIAKTEVELPVFKQHKLWWLFDRVSGQAVVFTGETGKENYRQPMKFPTEKIIGPPVIQSNSGELYVVSQPRLGIYGFQHFNTNTKQLDGPVQFVQHIFPSKVLIAQNHLVYAFKNAKGYYELTFEPFERVAVLH